MTSDNEKLFPIYSHEQRLEDESLDELRPLLRGYFLVRDQRQRDFGVDVTVEVVIDDRATNYVSMVQLKARSTLKPNVDGSLSLAMESPNVEYLLSGAASLIVLYDSPRKSFYWADVLEEVLVLNSKGIEHTQQGQITIRFRRQLNRANVAEFQEHLLVRARAARELRQKVARLEPGEHVHVDALGNSTTSNDIEASFLADGSQLATRGRIIDLEQMFGFLSAEARQSPRVRLLMAHAHASNGQVIAAWADLNEARRRVSDLSQDERDLFEVIEIGIENTLERSPLPELVERASAIRDRASPALRMQLDIAALRIEYNTAPDPTNVGRFVDRARAFVEAASLALGPLSPATLAARLLEIDLSGTALLMQYVKSMATWNLGNDALGKQLRGGQLTSEANIRLNAQLGEWLERNLAEQRMSAEYPHICIELEKSELVVQLLLVRLTRLMGLGSGVGPSISLDEAPAAELMLRLRRLRDRACALRLDDVEVRARLLIVELLDIADRHVDMRQEAEALISQCKASGDVRIEKEARAYCEGRSTFRRTRDAMVAPNKGRDVSDISQAERELLADQVLDWLNLPRERLPNVLDDIAATVREEELRKEWCRHFKIETFHDPKVDGPMLYARQPVRRCACTALGVSTELPSRWWRPLVGEFQRNYCNSCNRREK